MILLKMKTMSIFSKKTLEVQLELKMKNLESDRTHCQYELKLACNLIPRNTQFEKILNEPKTNLKIYIFFVSAFDIF